MLRTAKRVLLLLEHQFDDVDGVASFGLAVEVPSGMGPKGDYGGVSFVNDPWRVLSGGCGEACGHPR